MGEGSEPAVRATRPRVAIVLDNSFAHGRGVLGGILRYVRIHEPWTLLAFLHGPQFVSQLFDLPFDAAIIGLPNENIVQLMRARRVPVINVSSARDDLEFPSVQTDNPAAGRMAAGYFIERGFRHFAYVGDPNHAFSKGRLGGFSAELERRGSSCMVYDSPVNKVASEETFVGLAGWLKALPKPVAIFASDELHGWTVVGNCVQASLHVPEVVSVLVAGDDALVCQCADVPLSAVDLAGDQVGFLAAQWLDRLLEGDAPPATPVLVPPLRIITRQSSDALAIPIPEVAAAARLIRKSACDPLNVADVLSAIPVGRRWLEREYKRLVGRTIYDDILHQRIERGKILLGESNLKLAIVAQRCGFAHAQHFGTLFRRLTGLTPAAYRRTARFGAATPE